ncbi:response regulator transcription factor [Sinorhizobium meliloti]|uniref:response regulator transcription factor n=1 Tax=Rhizobium meliloti TaxID=382 RepID=UPI0012963A87|nr:response regulator [Sinorhizobium meliloti]MDW9393079.1 response regulator [Sinorhizobium meliloti]MDW9436965.1 response regulator [Sinorhizobium meliloti]MDW9478569.1 response regulator [Sinorhizobium meliloti]MDW9592802.1 response regulator [Sinorhizobium meliloti]MDW9618599.1 response regulator [Sinorhizobium meliloti]
MSGQQRTIAIVDDDELVRRALCRLVLSLSFTPVAFASGESFLKALDQTSPSCVLLDFHMPSLNGLDVLHELSARQEMPAVIVITGADDNGVRESCMRAGAAGFLNKPISRDTLSSAIEAVECGWRPRSKRLF